MIQNDKEEFLLEDLKDPMKSGLKGSHIGFTTSKRDSIQKIQIKLIEIVKSLR